MTTSQRKAITRITAQHQWTHEVESASHGWIIVTVQRGTFNRLQVAISPRGRIVGG